MGENRLTSDGVSESARRPLHASPQWLRSASVFGTLALFVLRDFLRSPWLPFNLVAIVLGHLAFFGEVPARTDFFSSAYVMTLALAALNMSGILSRANHPHIYPILARGISRATYVSASMLVAWIVSTVGYVLTGLLVFVKYGWLLREDGLVWLDLSTWLNASLPVAVGVMFIVCLLALLANFVAPFSVRLTVLALITIGVMMFDPRSLPIEPLRPVAQFVPPLLAPVVGALRYATDTTPDSVAKASILILAAYASTILALVLWLSDRREAVIE
jgi:hypothetical protein